MPGPTHDRDERGPCQEIMRQQQDRRQGHRSIVAPRNELRASRRALKDVVSIQCTTPPRIGLRKVPNLARFRCKTRSWNGICGYALEQMSNNVGENRSHNRVSPGAGRPSVPHQTEGNPQDGEECRPGHEVPVHIVKVEFLDQASPPSAGPMLHFREKRIYHIADVIAPVGGKLYGSHTFVAPTAELAKARPSGMLLKFRQGLRMAVIRIAA